MAVDIQYVLSVVSGVWFPLWINIGWLLGYLLIGFSALHPSVDHLSEPTPQRPERITAARLVALGLALSLAPLTELVATAVGVDVNPYILVAGAITGTVLVLARMSGLLRALQAQAVQLAALARNDGLTGIANRRTWDHELSRACASARDDDQPLTVALLDLDHFKTFNDTNGHVMGDLVLKETAAAWLELLDGHGFVARYGGEEFTVLLPNISLDAAEIILDRLRIAVSQGQTCSIGLTVWDGLEDPDHLVARADEALYHAKRNGRNRVAVHDGQRVRELGRSWPRSCRHAGRGRPSVRDRLRRHLCHLKPNVSPVGQVERSSIPLQSLCSCAVRRRVNVFGHQCRDRRSVGRRLVLAVRGGALISSPAGICRRGAPVEAASLCVRVLRPAAESFDRGGPRRGHGLLFAREAPLVAGLISKTLRRAEEQ